MVLFLIPQTFGKQDRARTVALQKSIKHAMGLRAHDGRIGKNIYATIRDQIFVPGGTELVRCWFTEVHSPFSRTAIPSYTPLPT